jgi:tRNA-binding EMAP/Myf-like protein
MRVSLTNIINQIFFRENKFDIFKKLAFLNKSLNSSFSGELENVTEAYLTPNIDNLLDLLEFFKIFETSKTIENHSTDFHNSNENLEYIYCLEFLSSLEKTPDNQGKDERFFEFEEEEDKILYQRKKNLLRFKKEFSEFFKKTFDKEENAALTFLASFEYFNYNQDKMADFFILDYQENFYSKYLLRIAQIVFADQINEAYAKQAEEIKENFEKILFNNGIWDNLEDRISPDNELNEFKSSFMKKLFWDPYKKLLKLKKIFDMEMSLGGKKNEELLVSIVLLASQIGIYQTKYSTEFIIKLIEEHLESEKNEKNLIILKRSHKVFSGFIKTLQTAKWDQGLLHVMEKIGIETENHEDKLEKLYKLLNLEIVKIFEIKKHPKADSLNLCKLSNGKEVVCGAGNVNFIKDNGHYTVYSPLGAYLPNGMIISPRDIRGVISKGMLCSPEEIGVDGCCFLKSFPNIFIDSALQDNEIFVNKSEKTSGIIVLFEPKDFNSDEGDEIPFVGKYFSMHSAADLSLTPNLGYLLGEMNLAKEIERFLELQDFHCEKEEPDSSLVSNDKNIIDNDFNLKRIISDSKNNLATFESEIIISEDAAHFFRNIFFFKTSESKIQFNKKDLEHLCVFSPGFDFEKENKVSALIKYFAGLYGIELHAIRKNSLKGRISIRLSLNDYDLEIHPKDFEGSKGKIKIFKGDLCAFDQDENIVFIPGVTNSILNCGILNENQNDLNHIREEEENNIIFIGFVFAKDSEKDFNFYVPQIQFAQREGINNKMTHFYQRQPSFDLGNFLKFEDCKLSKFLNLMDTEFLNHRFKKITFDIRDILILFKKDSKLVYGMIEEAHKNFIFRKNFEEGTFSSDDLIDDSNFKNGMTNLFLDPENDQKINSFFENIYKNFIQKEFKYLGFEILKEGVQPENKDNQFSFNMEVLIPIFRTDINSSIDLVGALYKILNFSNKLSVTNDRAPAFFKEIENSFGLSNRTFNSLKNILGANLNDYDENPDLNSFEIQEENSIIPMLHNGENSFIKCLYLAFKNLALLGFSEVLHFSFISEEKLDGFFESKNLIRLRSAINKTLTILRPNLLVGLLEKYKEIIKEKKDSSVLLFENGPIFLKNNPFEKMITGILGGKKFEKNPHLTSEYFSNNNFFDFFDSKAAILQVLEVCNVNENHLEFLAFDEFYDLEKREKFENFYKIIKDNWLFGFDSKDPYEKFFHPKKTALVFVKNLNYNSSNNEFEYIFIGYCGEINPFFLEKFDLIDQGHEKISTFMILQKSFERIHKNKKKYISSELFFSEFQSIQRDFALIFNEEITVSQIKKNILDNSLMNPKLKNLIHDLKIFDIFQNEELKKQKKKSVGFSFKIWSKEKTLNNAEVKEIVNLILEKIKNELDGVFASEI